MYDDFIFDIDLDDSVFLIHHMKKRDFSFSKKVYVFNLKRLRSQQPGPVSIY